MRSLFACFFVLLSMHGIAGVFDGVRLLPAEKRVVSAQQIFNKEVRYKDSVTAIRSVNELTAIANSLNDKPLQCLSISLLADQYARIRSANPLSEELHKEAISMAERFGLTLMKGIANYRLGRYYYNFKNYPVAFEYMLRADNIFRELGYKEVPDIDEILFFIGSIYYETGDYDKAEFFLQKVQKETITQYTCTHTQAIG
jgi:tetratricopeptide (TPR) repeat protein